MADDNHTGRKLAVGALVAGVAGYVTGILTAPKSGRQTREDIKDKAGDVKTEVETKLQEAHDELDHLLKNTKNKTVGMGAKARQDFNESVVKAKDAKNKTVYLLKAVKAGESDHPELGKALRQAKSAGRNLRKYIKS